MQPHQPSPNNHQPQQPAPGQPYHTPKPADDDIVVGALSLALSVAIPPVGAILGIIALKKSRSGTPGHLLGLFGLVCGVLFTIACVAYFVFILATSDYEEVDSDPGYSSAQEL